MPCDFDTIKTLLFQMYEEIDIYERARSVLSLLPVIDIICRPELVLPDQMLNHASTGDPIWLLA